MNKLLPILFLLLFLFAKPDLFGQPNPRYKTKTDSLNAMRSYQNTIKVTSEVLNSKTANKAALAGIYMVRGVAEMRLNNFSKSVSDLSASINLNSQIVDTYFNRAIAYEYLRKYQPAVYDYHKVLELIPDNKDQRTLIYHAIAVDEKNLMHYDKAIEADSAALALSPRFIPPYENRAFAYAMTGKYQLAANDFSSAMFGYQNNPHALSWLLSRRAEMKRSMKYYKDAITDFSEAIKMDATNKFAFWNRAACYYANGDYQLANDDYSKAIIFFKGDNISLAKLYDDRAQMEIGLQQFPKAIADDSLAVAANPQFYFAYWNKANAHAQNGDYAMSNALYRKTLPYFQNNNKAVAQLYADIAHNEYFLNNFEADVNDCTLAIKADGKYYDPYMERGRAYIKLNKKDLALSDFKQVLALDSTKQTSDYAFALFYTGDGDKAYRIMQNALLATTNTFTTMINYYNIACLLSLMNKSDEANAYLKKCIDSGYPKRYAIADTDFDNIRNTDDYKATIAGAHQ